MAKKKKKSNIDKQRIDRGSNLYEEKGNSGFNMFSEAMAGLLRVSLM